MIHITQKTLTDLEFPTVLEQLSTHCTTEMGKAKARKIVPFSTPAAALFALHQTQEYKSSAWQDTRIPNHGFDPINREIHLLGIENSVIDSIGFQKISALSNTVNTLLSFFSKRDELYPCLAKTAETVDYTDHLILHINQVIDKFGQVKNEASPLLQQIRLRLNAIQHKIDASFSADMTTYSNAGYLDDIKESVIDHKRVLAVAAMHKKKVKGLLLGRSKTGSIVFIQPQNTLQFWREYSNLTYDEKEEINRILHELTETIRPYLSLLIDYQDFLSTLDVVAAKVKYAHTMNACLPKITRQRELELKEAYHPLLFLANQKSGKKTYPQDLTLNADNQIIVISGPNAGGKSITLKTVGLLQIMLQSGLLVPVHEYSRMCFFTKVLSDIGDHQSIENHLSTYSYRLKNMRYFLQKCDAETLFLIDEFGTGTDPELGGALAETFLEVFHERQAFGIITTHYANLKKMAGETEGILNANMRFDNYSLEPEFKLILGEAGSSFTFEVAEKNHIPYSLINRSKKKVERGKIRFDKSIAKLQQERSKLANTNQKLKKEKLKAVEHKEQLAHKNTRIQQKLEDFQELYDDHQQLIYLGRKLDKLSKAFALNNNKKQFIAEVLRLAAIENSKRKQQHKKQRQQEERHKQKIKDEAEKKLALIRKQKQAAQKIALQKAQEAEIKKIESLKANDRVRIEGSTAVGIIDRIEKGRARINYGKFTTEAPLKKLELVKKAK